MKTEDCITVKIRVYKNVWAGSGWATIYLKDRYHLFFIFTYIYIQGDTQSRMKREKTHRVLQGCHSSSKDPTPTKNKDSAIARGVPKDISERVLSALYKIQQRLNSFLVENFQIVLETTYDSSKYSRRVSALLDELRSVQVQILNSIFKKLANAIQPLIVFPIRARQSSNQPASTRQKRTHQTTQDLTVENNQIDFKESLKRVERELRIKEQQLAEYAQENHKLRSTLKTQLQRIEEDRQKQNRMTELLYILRKKNIDIDRIYEENCQTPLVSKKNSVSQDSEWIDNQ